MVLNYPGGRFMISEDNLSIFMLLLLTNVTEATTVHKLSG